MKILIEEYNPEWPTLFQKEKSQLEKVLSDIKFEIEHIGSTSIEGLGAKPVIDIMIGVYDFSIINNQIEKITNLGYQYINAYEDVMPYRRFFIKEKEKVRTHHIHMVEINTEFWLRHLAFRDYLINHPIEKLEYYNLKKELSRREWKDGNEYAAAKTDFIQMIMRKII